MALDFFGKAAPKWYISIYMHLLNYKKEYGIKGGGGASIRDFLIKAPCTIITYSVIFSKESIQTHGNYATTKYVIPTFK